MFKLFLEELRKTSKRYVFNVLVALDQFVNTLFYGDPDETISSRLGKNYKGTWMKKFVDWLFGWQKYPQGHTEASIEWDEGKNSILK